MPQGALGETASSFELKDSMDARKKKYPILRKCKNCELICKQHGGANMSRFECTDFKKA